MPTKKKRINIIPDNLGSLTGPSDFVPSLYTGNKLAEKDPQKYSRIVLALGERKPVTRIAKEEKCSPDTIMAIAKREKKSIDAVNELTAGLTAFAAQACVMKLIEKLEADQIPVGVLPIATGILIDKARAYSGEATAVIEHRKSVSIEDVRKELEEMKKDAIEIDIKEI